MQKKYLAELLGTAFLVLIGCGAAAIAGAYVGVLGIAFAFGIAVVVMAYAIGPISGCHINPAITLGAYLDKRISKVEALNYVVYQFAGGILGAFVLYVLVSNGFTREVMSMGANAYGAHSLGNYGIFAAFTAEVIFTALFVFVVLAATAKNANTKFAGLAIGLALFIIHIVCIPITGTSVNPARSFGPALFTSIEAIWQSWLFIVAPFIGGAAGAFLWKFLRTEQS
ncbi:MAG: MIP family channel protein [Elusimicrobia bacterium]|nr:MIP family channel protein [Elusimicrobiota bacterium]